MICATGYRTGLEPIVGHLGLLDERGQPRVHGGATLPRLPGLFVVGVSVELAGLLREIGREARAVARALAESSHAAV